MLLKMGDLDFRMNQVKLKDFIKEEKIVTPLYVLRLYKDLDITKDELILLMYLYNQDKCVFDPNKISFELGLDLMDIMALISNLTEKKLVMVNTTKDEKGIMQEVFDLSDLYEKIAVNIIKELNTKEENTLNMHDLIEKEFARRLTPLEHEMIDDWEEDNSKELIKEAVKEASINGVSNLRYIDKILFDWNKAGIKNPSDIKKEKPEEIKEEIYNCDWLNDDDEEI